MLDAALDVLLGRLRRVLKDFQIVISTETQRESQKNCTVYNFDTIDVDGKPEVLFKCLKRLVGERGFEPPTPWSRTRCSTRLSHSPTAPRAAIMEGPSPAFTFGQANKL